jgi:hypothetical protein
MLSKINSCAIHGIDAYIVEVETQTESSISYFSIFKLTENHVRHVKKCWPHHLISETTMC